MESLDIKDVTKKLMDAEKEIAQLKNNNIKLTLVVKGLRSKMTIMRSNLTSLEAKVAMIQRSGRT